MHVRLSVRSPYIKAQAYSHHPHPLLSSIPSPLADRYYPQLVLIPLSLYRASEVTADDVRPSAMSDFSSPFQTERVFGGRFPVTLSKLNAK